MTRRIALCIGIALLVGGVTPAASVSKYPPGPPYRSCPDTLTLFSVQNTDTIAAPCHPATLDTVLGVRGIITGFDAKAGAYGFYIQNAFANGPHAWTGVDVFTGATNYNSSVPGTPTGGNLALGDSVVVYGTTQEFASGTEVEGPDQSQSTNDILIRRINSGNPLPAAKVGTTHDFNWTAAATAEPWEGCLVRINGPMHVARTAQGLGIGANQFLVVSPSFPNDSVMVDGNTLTTFGAPPVSTNIDFVQGILDQRSTYRIQLRDANDIGTAVPPNLIDAYPLEDNTLRLVFDKNLDPSSAQNPSNYQLGSVLSGSTVNTAILVGGAGTRVDLGISSAFGDGVAETITAYNIGTATCPSCVSSFQTQPFFNGVMAISMVQAPDPSFLGSCQDRSRFAGAGTSAGDRITVRGVATQSYGSLSYFEDAAFAADLRSSIPDRRPGPGIRRRDRTGEHRRHHRRGRAAHAPHPGADRARPGRLHLRRLADPQHR